MDHPLHELNITGFAYGGEAIGRLHSEAGDRVVFVPFALPGERVRVRLVEERRGFARAELVEVLEPAPDRIQPRCRHFGVCGGCHYQQTPYEAQLQAKTEIVRDQLRRIGHIDEPPVQGAVASPAAWNYRNQVQFHLTPDGRLGYVPASAPLRSKLAESPVERSGGLAVMPIAECHLPEPALNDLWPKLECEPAVEIDRISIRQGAGEELMVLLESEGDELPELELEAGVSVVHAFDEHAVVMAGSDHILMHLAGRDFRVSAPSFFQVNTAMAEQMVQHVLAQLPASCGTIIDAYCGVGLFSAFLAPRCEHLIGIEASESACEDFGVNLDEFENVELYEDAAEYVLPALGAQADIIVVDPPRAGLDPIAVDAIVEIGPRDLIYVSCDPSTLARDAARLIKGGYSLESVTPFDLFPQTYHIESISVFKRIVSQ